MLVFILVKYTPHKELKSFLWLVYATYHENGVFICSFSISTNTLKTKAIECFCKLQQKQSVSQSWCHNVKAWMAR